jgi:type II secretory pathway component PulC
LFKELGFREHDIVTRINDKILDNLSASFEVIKLLKQTKNFDFYLDRQGEQHIITIDLN